MNIKRAFRKLGIIKSKPLVNSNGRPKLNVSADEIFVLHCRGLSNCEIARKFGISEGTVRNRLKKVSKSE